MVNPTRRQARIDWLLANPGLWEGWEGRDDKRRWRLIEAMRDAQVIAPTTYWADVQIENLILDARKQRREKKYGQHE